MMNDVKCKMQFDAFMPTRDAFSGRHTSLVKTTTVGLWGVFISAMGVRTSWYEKVVVEGEQEKEEVVQNWNCWQLGTIATRIVPKSNTRKWCCCWPGGCFQRIQLHQGFVSDVKLWHAFLSLSNQPPFSPPPPPLSPSSPPFPSSPFS